MRFYYVCRKKQLKRNYILRLWLSYALNALKEKMEGEWEGLCFIVDDILCLLSPAKVKRLIRKFLVKHLADTLLDKKRKNGRVLKAPESSSEKYNTFVLFFESSYEYPDGSVPALKEIIAMAEVQLEKLTKSGMKKTDFLEIRLEELKRLFLLTDTEVKVIEFFFILHHIPKIRRTLENGNLLESRFREKSTIVNLLSVITGSCRTEMEKALRKTSILTKAGLLELKTNGLSTEIQEYLTGTSDMPLSERFYKKFKGETMDFSGHPELPQHADIIERLFQNRKANDSTHILLYGEPGTGKTEFARALSKKLGRELFEIRSFSDEDEKLNSGIRYRLTSLFACRNIVDHNKSLILIDEADEILNGERQGFFGMQVVSPNKNIINEVMDQHPGSYIWITNRYQEIDPSILRRFDYSIRFDPFNQKQRILLWQAALKKHGLSNVISKEQIGSLAVKFKVNAGGIDIAVRNYCRMHKKTDPVNMQDFETLLQQQLELLKPHASTDSQEPVSYYSLEGLHITSDRDLETIIQNLSRFCEVQIRKDSALAEVKNMNILMSGPPGTGKTEFAKYLACRLGKQLVRKSASDFIDKYVGETEKRIRETFRQAESENAILFIDEAEGLFRDRSSAVRSFEITQLNELLIRMEEFTGILLCATNHLFQMDKASLRRFNFRVEFGTLTRNGKRILFEKTLLGLLRQTPSEDDWILLDRLEDLVPGDFKVVRQRHLLQDESERKFRLMISELETEARSRKEIKTAKVGFS